MKDTILITHRHCMDGAGCAVLYRAMGGLKENIKFVGPESISKTVNELINTYSGHLLFADMAVNEEDAKLLDARGDITILDHHQTSAHLKKYPWAHISVGVEGDNGAGAACGTLMMWKHFLLQHSEIAEYEGMARMIDDHDRWIHQNPMSQKFADFNYLTNTDYFIDRFLKDSRVRLDETMEAFLDIDKVKKEEYFKNKMDDVTIIQREGKKIGVVVGNRYISEFCHYLLINHPKDLDVLCMIDAEENKVSLRSKKDGIDVAKIAQLNGGGGHTSAAGFFLRGDLDLKLKENFIKKFKTTAKRTRFTKKESD